MKEIELYDALEKLEHEKRSLINAPEYRRAAGLKNYMTCLKHGDLGRLGKMLLDKKAAQKIKKKQYSHKLQSVEKKNDADYTRCKIAIYTAVIGGYDHIPRHLVSFDNVDYILYVDDESRYQEYRPQYDVREIPQEIVQKGKIYANRYFKFHPSEFLKGYDYAIYLDGNVRIISDVRPFVNYCSEATGLAMHAHRERDCIYDEAEVCLLYRRGVPEKIKAQMQRYKDEGFPEHFGMNEATVIVSDLHNPVSKELLDSWWLEFEKSECKRDQLIWPYILWEHNLGISDVGCLGNDIYDNYKLEIVRHAK